MFYRQHYQKVQPTNRHEIAEESQLSGISCAFKTKSKRYQALDVMLRYINHIESNSSTRCCVPQCLCEKKQISPLDLINKQAAHLQCALTSAQAHCQHNNTLHVYIYSKLSNTIFDKRKVSLLSLNRLESCSFKNS